MDLVLGIAYGSDPQKALNLVRELLQNHEGVLQSPEPVVLLQNFRDWAIDIQAMFWISDLGQAGTMKSTVLTEIYALLQEAGINIAHPGPQQVQIKMDTMGWKPPAGD